VPKFWDSTTKLHESMKERMRIERSTTARERT
jgi:hypothetical protein